jgi:glucose/arabinose dehydrogenase
MREENILFFNKRLQIVIVFLSISLGIISIVIYLLNSNDSLLLLLDKKQQEQLLQQKENPSFKDPDENPPLNVELVAKGLSSPTSMSFIDNNNLLVLEKNGQVRLISNGVLQKQPVLTVSVDTTAERGLLGIAMLRGDDNSSSNSSGEKVDRNTTKVNTTTSEMIDTKTATTIIRGPNTTNSKVFLYFTESKPGQLLRNRVYGYDWNGEKHRLSNPKLLLDLPAMPGPYHNGGKLAIGPDHYLYAVIGNLNTGDGILQNNKHGKDPDNTSVIIRINPDDSAAAAAAAPDNNPFVGINNNKKLSSYYAYGIRNSFGITFDPITGYMWDTENGEANYDEVNLVKPGFNSGWYPVMGPISRTNVTERDLVNFKGSHYADPMFSWYNAIGVTDIEFLKSSKLGQKYTNNIFVGDINNGNLYYFEVNKSRTGLKFNPNTQPGLSDMVADDKDEVSKITFATGFGSITDIKTGPDGFLYVLSYGYGSLYRITRAQS